MFYVLDLSSKPALVVIASDDESAAEATRAIYMSQRPSHVLVMCEGESEADRLAHTTWEAARVDEAAREAARAQEIDAAEAEALARIVEADKAREHVSRLRSNVTPIVKSTS